MPAAGHVTFITMCASDIGDIAAVDRQMNNDFIPEVSRSLHDQVRAAVSGSLGRLNAEDAGHESENEKQPGHKIRFHVASLSGDERAATL